MIFFFSRGEMNTQENVYQFTPLVKYGVNWCMNDYVLSKCILDEFLFQTEYQINTFVLRKVICHIQQRGQ